MSHQRRSELFEIPSEISYDRVKSGMAAQLHLNP